MPADNILQQKSLNNSQVIGLVTGLFIVFGFYFNSTKTTDEFAIFKKNEHEYREEAAKEYDELKGLIYRLVRESKQEINSRVDRKVNPLVKEVDAHDDWINFQKGVQSVKKE